MVNKIFKFKTLAALIIFIINAITIKAQCVVANIEPSPGVTPASLAYTCPDAGIHCIASTGAEGDAWIKYSPLNGGQLKKPFVFVEGLDLNITAEATHRHGARGWPNFITGTTDENDLTEKVFEKAPILINELLARGYDVIYLDHSHGGTYMQDNAKVFVDLIKKINQQKVGNEQIIVAAASMGGQTVKYGISLMESENYKHCIADYISIDSPHQGANIPLGFQAMIKEYKFLATALETLYSGLSLPAAQQLLLSHLEAPNNNSPHPLRTSWLNDLNAVGNYPKYCRKVAITSGNILGSELFPESSKILTLNLRTVINGCSRGLNLLDINVWSQPGNAGNHVFYSRRPAGASLNEMWANDQACGATCPVCLSDPSVYYDFDYKTVNSSALRLDNCPGGKRNTAKQFVDKINAAISNSQVSGFIDAITEITYNQEFHGFIPTISGLDANTSNLFENVQNFIGSNNNPVPSKYPFDAYYGETGESKFHVEITGDVQNGNIKWILDEATKIKTPIANPLTNAAPNSGVYNYSRYENKLLSSLVIENGGKLLVNANLRSEYAANTPAPYDQFVTQFPLSQGTTYTLETCYCNNVVVEVNNNGEFILGDNNGANNNKGVVLFHDGSKLFVKNGGKLTIRRGSKLVMEENTVLTVEQGGQIIIEQGAEIVVKGASQFISSGQIIINGGKITQEPLSKLDLNSTSKLVVNDNSQVVIQTTIAPGGNSSENGILTYNQGAEIQLKGDNAVLELNGRLHIGDNATFGITYPGSNSGYIKFNRGAGVWWNNWAPNNAHITCGVNSKISLIGQNKTDKIIDISQDNVAIPKNLTQFVMSKCLVEFNVGNARLETDRPTVITNSTFKGNYTPLSNQSDYTRGLLVFGQPICIINGCDFRDLGVGITGALFYGGNKLTGVKNCNFYNIGGIITYGSGVNISNNYLSGAAIQVVDASLNSLISNNTITKYNQNTTYEPNGIGVIVDGANVEFDIRKNSINNLEYALMTAAGNVKLSCNNLQNNQTGLFAGVDSKINMSSALGAGFNNADNCEKFAQLYEANLFEANDGYNNFKIIDDVPCTWIPQSGHGPYIIPGHWDCPTIIEGSIINFTGQNATSGVYENFAEYNFWRPLVSSTDVIEDRQNKIRKLTYTSDPNNPMIDSASIITNNFLSNTNLVNCPTNGNGVNVTHFKPHPMDNNSNSSIISTASFYNKSLQEALQLSLSKMDKMQNSMKVNEAADLFTEILKYNYNNPVTNSADKYLLELAYQKLYTCVAQLAEWHKETSTNFLPLPINLQNRINDLHSICALRIGRKSITEADYKEINHLILLDKAFIYRLTNDYSNALSIMNFITSNFPKAQHLVSFENYKCIWNTENEALNGNLTTDEALLLLASCQKTYNLYPKQNSTSSRKSSVSKSTEIEYSNDYEIVVYPNPANNSLMIGYSLREFKKITFEIYDVQGKLMTHYNLNSEATKFDIDDLNLQNGIYFYTIKGDEKMLMNKKLVILK